MRALVPEDLNGNAQRRSLTRAVTAIALAHVKKTSAASMLARSWPSDHLAERTLTALNRAAVAPTSTASAPALQTQCVRMLAHLAPRSAALQLFNASTVIEMKGGIATVVLPNVGVITPAVFVIEGGAAPVVKFQFGSITLGPTRKILILSALSNELKKASPEDAETLIGRLLSASAEKGIDAVALGTAAADDAAPAGLLHNVTPIAPTAGGGEHAMVTDIANLVAALATAGFDAANAIFVAATKQATVLRLLASPRFTNQVFMSSMLAAGTIACFAPDAVAAAYEDAPQVETSIETTLHFEDAALPIADDSGVLAAPTRNMFQEDALAIKCRARLAWSAAPGGAQVVNGTSW